MRNDIKARRAERRWSQAELGKALGVSRQTVIAIENDRYDPSLPLAFVISVPLILAVGFLQFFLLPALNWIFAFSILMLAWIVGTIVSAVRYR